MEATYTPASEVIMLDITNKVGIFDNKIVIGPIYNEEQMTLNLIIHELQSDGDIVLGMDHATTSNISIPLPFRLVNYTSICTKNYCVVTTIDPNFQIATRIFVINLENGTHIEHIIYNINVFGYGIVDDELYLASDLITGVGTRQGIRTFYKMNLITTLIYPSSSHYIFGATIPGIADTYLGTMILNKRFEDIIEATTLSDGKPILEIENTSKYPFLAYDGMYHTVSGEIFFSYYGGETYRIIKFEEENPIYQEARIVFSDSIRGELWVLIYQDEATGIGYYGKYRRKGGNRRDKLTKNARTI